MIYIDIKGKYAIAKNVPYRYRKYMIEAGFTWDKKEKVWKILTEVQLFKSLKYLKKKGVIFQVSPKVQKLKNHYIKIYKDPLNIKDFRPTKPSMKHQLISTKLILKRKRFGLFNKMGTGKTKCVIDALEYLMQKGLVRNPLIVCPKNLIGKWKKEIQKFSNIPVDQITIINYDFFSRNKVDNKYDFIALDEATAIKNPKAKRTKNLTELGVGVPYKIAITGTPYTQSIVDLWSIFYFLDGGYTLGPKLNKFLEQYAYTIEIRPKHNKKLVIKKYKPLKHKLPEITDLIAKRSVAFTEEVMEDLPQVVEDQRPLIPSKEILKLHEMFKAGLIKDFEDKARLHTLKNTIIRMHQITSGLETYVKVDKATGHERTFINFIDDNPKLDAVVEILSEETQGKKVLIWRYFVQEDILLSKAVKKAGLQPLLLNTNTKDPEKVIERFMKKDNTVLIASIMANKFGLDIFADVVIYYSLPFSVESFIQSKHRAIRIGSKKHVTIIYLYYEKLMDEYVLQSLSANIDVLNTTIKDLKKFLK